MGKINDEIISKIRQDLTKLWSWV